MDQTADRPPRPSALSTASDRARWIVLVATGQQDLYEHLRHAFRSDGKVEVVLDRRKNVRRNPPWVVERLRSHGAAVIRREW